MKTITTAYPDNEALTEGHKFYPWVNPVDHYTTSFEVTKLSWSKNFIENIQGDCACDFKGLWTRRIVFDANSTNKDGYAENVERYELVDNGDDVVMAYAVFVDGTCELRSYNPESLTLTQFLEWFDLEVMTDPIREITAHNKALDAVLRESALNQPRNWK
jgi:hypothetical protein